MPSTPGGVSRDGFSQKVTLKWGGGGGGSEQSILTKKYMFILIKNYKMQWQINDSLRNRNFLFNGRRVVCVIIASVQQGTSPWRWLAEIKHWSLTRHRPLLQNLLIASKHSYSSLSSCFCSLLVPANILRHLDTSFSVQAPPWNWNPSWFRPRVRFLGFFTGALLRNFDMADPVLLITEFSSSHILSTAVRTCAFGFMYWFLGQNLKVQNNTYRR